MTKGELVSLVWHDLRALNKDEHLSRRHILNTAQSYAKDYVTKKLTDGTLFKEEKLFSTIKCFELEKDDIVKCDIVEFKRCNNLMKSKEQLPDLISSRFGPAVVSVRSVSGQDFSLTSPSAFSNLKYSKFPNLSRFLYYVEDNYLYLPDSEFELVDIKILTLDTESVDELSGCSTCDECESTWDKTFVCPDRHIRDVINATVAELSGTWRRITPDENPDKDSNIRSQKSV